MDYNKSELDFFIVALKEEARSILWQVGSDADYESLISNVIEDLQAVALCENDTRTDEEIWTQARGILLKAAYATRPYCIRCGTCCTKGSPTLLAEDIRAFQNNILKPTDVITIRKGEYVYCNRSEKLEQAKREMIKIKEVEGERICIFYSSNERSCKIYKFRPKQCMLQECWNSETSYHIDEMEYLDRKRLLEDTGPLWEIIKRHEEKCAHSEFTIVMARLAATKGHTVQDLLDLLSYDHHVREFVAERFQLTPESLDFFLGRPLSESLPAYGLKLEHHQDGSFVLTPRE